MTAAYAFHGYAILSEDDCIADASGVLPDSLKSDADWRYFQAELDLCQLVLLGRVSHEGAPNPSGRRRLVVSSTARGLETRADALWWNPADLGLDAVIARILPDGGRIGVPGGQGVFDLVLGGPGFDGFHLTRARGVVLPGGRPVFGGCGAGSTAETVLSGLSYAPDETRTLEAGIELAIWRKAGSRRA